MSGKLALKYQGTEIEAMKQVAQASKNRSLAEFQTVRCVQQYEILGGVDRYTAYIGHLTTI